MREFLKGLELDKETIDTIMAEYGKSVQGLREEKDDLTGKINLYKEEIEKLKESSTENESWKTKFEELDSKIQKQEADKKAKEEDEMLTNNIMSSIGEKKFASDYAKKGLIADIKSELAKPENKGKGISEITDLLTKDKEGIFENPNKPKDMTPMGSVNNSSEITKETFAKMGYKDRLNLKNENPELYSELAK